MLETILVILFILWLLGFGLGVMGNFIHVLLLLILAGIIYRLVKGKTAL